MRPIIRVITEIDPEMTDDKPKMLKKGEKIPSWQLLPSQD